MSSAAKLLQASGGVQLKTYVDDVFAGLPYTGTNAAGNVITTGIDATKGIMIWLKSRASFGYDNVIQDSTLGFNSSSILRANSTGSGSSSGFGSVPVTATSSTGFTLGATTQTNYTYRYMSWSFRKAAKFFDIVNYTGNGSTRTVAHSLGAVPGLILVKRVDGTTDWAVWHRSIASTQYLQLNTTAAPQTSGNYWNNTDPTSSVFSLGGGSDTNASTGNYIAYIFGHDTSSDGLVQCGTFTLASGVASISLGWEPQWVLWKRTDTTENWSIEDNMRAMSLASPGEQLHPNLNALPDTATGYIRPTASGFNTNSAAFGTGNSGTYVYMAIRCPNKTPTAGTQVLDISTGDLNAGVTSTILADMWFYCGRGSGDPSGNKYEASRLVGQKTKLVNTNSAESTNTCDWDKAYVFSEGFAALSSRVTYFLKKAPGCFTMFGYTGTGSNKTEAHNLGVVPELWIVKQRDNTGSWQVGCSAFTAANAMQMETTAAAASATTVWNSTAPTASVLSVGTSTATNNSSSPYVAYLFATLAGVSKVGSYTGNGTSLTINCGFAAGARFILIKRYDSTGDWYVWDTVRGIVSGNDPHISMNTTSAEVTSDDSIDPDSSGFIVNQVAATNINVSAATYIFLAIA